MKLRRPMKKFENILHEWKIGELNSTFSENITWKTLYFNKCISKPFGANRGAMFRGWSC